jgi:hypothetical protein
MKTLALGLLVMLGATLSAFAQKIEIESDQATDFSRFKTFAIREGRLNSRNPSLNSDLIRKRLNADIRKYLEAKGLALIASGPSDLNVFYTLGAVRKTQVETYPAGWRGWGTRVVRVPYTEGTLVIDLRDTSTRSLVWRAIARQDKSDAAKIEGKIDDMVKKSFDKYPPKAR